MAVRSFEWILMQEMSLQEYKKLGYKEIGIVPTEFNGIPDVQLVLLEKHL